MGKPSCNGIQVSQFVQAARRPGEGDRVADARHPRWRQTPGAAGSHRLGQDLHDGQDHRGAESPRADHGAQQDPGGAALPRVQIVLPAQCGRVLCLVLRLLPAGSLYSRGRRLHREGSDGQRRARQAASGGHQVAVRASRLHHCCVGELHLRLGIAGSLLRHAAVPGKGTEDQARRHCPQAGRNSLRAHRGRLPPRDLSGARRHHRNFPNLRGQRLSHRAMGR